MIDSATLEILISEGENSRVEFKVAPPRPAELAERLCGFANSLGGTIVLGVKDQTWEVVGLKSCAEAIDTLLRAARLCRPPVQFTPPQPQEVLVKGKKLVVATIPPNNGQLYQASGSFYTRRGTHSIPLSLEEIQAHLNQTGALQWERRPVLNATLGDLDRAKLKEFLERRFNRTRLPAGEAELAELLVKIECARREEGEVKPTNAALLLFGVNPHDFIFQAEIVVGVFTPGNSGRGFTDRRIISGTLPEQIDQTETWLKLYNPVASKIKDFHRVDRPDYPLAALREAVVNAVVHRDYSLEGQGVRIFVYPGDRIDIYSPGELVPGLSLDRLREGQLVSRPRNPLIANFLREFPGNYMERMGLGVNFMISEMRELGRPVPDFREISGDFCVTFSRGSGEKGQEQETPITGALAAQESPVKEEAEGKLEERAALALKFVRDNGAITNRQYCELTGVSDRTALRDLEILAMRGALRAVGKNRGRKYLL